MSEQPEPFFTRGMAFALAFAVLGAAVIAFGFVPALAPGTDPAWVFGSAFAFLLVVMLAGHLVRSRK